MYVTKCYRVEIFWHPQFLRVGKVLEALQIKWQVFVTFLCLSAVLSKALSHCIYVLFCLPAVRGLPLGVDSSSGAVSLLLALGVCGVAVLKLSQGGPARLTVSVLKHFVPLLCASQQCCWQHGAGTLKGTRCALLVELVKLVCFYLCQVLHVTYKLLSPPWLETA